MRQLLLPSFLIQTFTPTRKMVSGNGTKCHLVEPLEAVLSVPASIKASGETAKMGNVLVVSFYLFLLLTMKLSNVQNLQLQHLYLFLNCEIAHVLWYPN